MTGDDAGLRDYRPSPTVTAKCFKQSHCNQQLAAVALGWNTVNGKTKEVPIFLIKNIDEMTFTVIHGHQQMELFDRLDVSLPISGLSK